MITSILAFTTLQLTSRRTIDQQSGRHQRTRESALAHIDKLFGGMETSEVSVRWHPDVAPDDGEIATVVSQVDDVLRGEPLIGHPLSIRNLIDALPGEGIRRRMSLLELLPPPLKRAYYPRATIREASPFDSRTSGSPRMVRCSSESRRNCSDPARHPDFRIELTRRRGVALEESVPVVVDLAFSLGTASVIIFAVLGVRLSLASARADLGGSEHVSARGDWLPVVGGWPES